jgi:hypothetical protein
VVCKHVDVVRAIVAHVGNDGGSLVSQSNNLAGNQTAIYVAVKHGLQTALKILLDGLKVEAQEVLAPKDHGDKTTLDVAKEKGDQMMMMMMMELLETL